jgi:hypothetical protein
MLPRPLLSVCTKPVVLSAPALRAGEQGRIRIGARSAACRRTGSGRAARGGSGRRCGRPRRLLGVQSDGGALAAARSRRLRAGGGALEAAMPVRRCCGGAEALTARAVARLEVRESAIAAVCCCVLRWVGDGKWSAGVLERRAAAMRLRRAPDRLLCTVPSRLPAWPRPSLPKGAQPPPAAQTRSAMSVGQMSHTPASAAAAAAARHRRDGAPAALERAGCAAPPVGRRIHQARHSQLRDAAHQPGARWRARGGCRGVPGAPAPLGGAAGAGV